MFNFKIGDENQIQILTMDMVVTIISEEYGNHEENTWERDLSTQAAICICGQKTIQEKIDQTHDGFSGIKIGDVYIHSFYASPNIPMEKFKRVIYELMRGPVRYCPTDIGGDFNAWAT